MQVCNKFFEPSTKHSTSATHLKKLAAQTQTNQQHASIIDASIIHEYQQQCDTLSHVEPVPLPPLEDSDDEDSFCQEEIEQAVEEVLGISLLIHPL